MENFQERLDEIIDKIGYLESRRIKMGIFLKEINDSFKIGPNKRFLILKSSTKFLSENSKK